MNQYLKAGGMFGKTEEQIKSHVGQALCDEWGRKEQQNEKIRESRVACRMCVCVV